MGNLISGCCSRKSTSDPLIHQKLDCNDQTSNDTQNAEQAALGENNEESLNIRKKEIEHLKIETALMRQQLDSKCFYKMDHKNRGLALIFNHETFDAHKARTGTDVDRNRLKKTLTSLDFHVKCYENLTIEDIKNKLKEVSEMDHTENDCLMIVVLTHGELVPLKDRKGKHFTTILTHDLFSYIHATDNKYPLQTIWEQFTDERCPSLKNKPKIFLISACQGDNIDEGFKINDSCVSYNAQSRSIERDIIQPFPSAKYMPFDKVKLDRSKTLPQKDFIVVYSSVSGFYSYRDTVKGTWFIDAFCDVLDANTDEIDLFGILTLINGKVAFDYQSHGGDAFKQIPCIVSMLTKLIVFKKKNQLTNGHC